MSDDRQPTTDDRRPTAEASAEGHVRAALRDRPASEPRTIKTWPFNWRLIRYKPGAFALFTIFTLLFLGARVLPGLIEKMIFDTITGAAPARAGLWSLVALYISVELARLASSFGMVWSDVTFRYSVGALLRRNLLASLLRRPGASILPVSASCRSRPARPSAATATTWTRWPTSQPGCRTWPAMSWRR
jgi:ATP-binding cassette, subfamily B, bacterial